MRATIALLAGDGIGPEIMQSTIPTLRAVERLFAHTFATEDGLVGGAAFDVYGEHFPKATKDLCDRSDAILFGSVGGPITESHLPKWQGCEANSILALRKTYKFFANLRPARIFPEVAHCSPLKSEVLGSGVDILIIRELIGDIYFGAHRIDRESTPHSASDIAEYTSDQIINIAKVAFEAARLRKNRVTSVDKANVLATSKLWREVVTELHRESYADVTLEHILVDNCAMQLVKDPASFDVLLTPNLFGDILSDLAAVLPGSLGLTPSASLNTDGFGLYEPSGGSAPDIAGKDIANPIAQILSFAMLLRHSFSLEKEARAVERGVECALRDGFRTLDLAARTEALRGNEQVVGTKEFGKVVAERICAEN